MQDNQKIIGRRRVELLNQLKKDKTSLRMHVLGAEYERLTIIMGIRTSRGIPHFLIDYPNGFREAVADLNVWKMRFEFTGHDKIPHVFNTSGGEITENGIWIRFPKAIERLQRRKYFRLDAPLGTKIHVTRKSGRHEMNVINVSQGGALVSSRKAALKMIDLQIGEYLKRLGLEFPSREEKMLVDINEALVKRMEEDPQRDHSQYGLQFTRVERDKRSLLKDLIYRFQRKYLRKRGFIDD